ncbi:MAG TPA: type I restriction endonuclease subunit R [Fimbriimonadaceae bacterium]|jgi:type I restriction enzyme R subunit
MTLNEDTLVQQTTADYLRNSLGWDSIYAFNQEDYGDGSLLGRKDQRETLLLRDVRDALKRLNPDLPVEAYRDAERQLIEANASLSLLSQNQEKYSLARDGILVSFRDVQGNLQKKRLAVIDFDNIENNRFLAVRELWIQGEIYRRRADIVGFINGLPLLFIECKAIHRDLSHAVNENLKDYADTIPHAFHHNAILLIGNGVKGKIGALGSSYKFFHEWKRLEESEPGVVDMETLLKGVCDRRNLLDLMENFILFDDSSGKTVKIVGKNHQFLGVNRAIQSVRDRRERQGKLGVFWHTQGSGKSYSMVFFTRKVHRKLGGNFTFLVLTDRDDLDSQIYKTFTGCGVTRGDPEQFRAGSGDHLKKMLAEHKSYVFTLIQKFNQDVSPEDAWSNRDDIIVMSDEAHRTQYGRLALNMRNAIPQASYIGFTGTPLFKSDEITRRVFGDYVSTYDFQRAVDDGATVPLFYDARGEKLGLAHTELNDKIADVLERLDEYDLDVNQRARLENDLQREYHIIAAEPRLERIAADFVEHYSTSWESGKAMIVGIDKITCVRLYDLIKPRWLKRIRELESELRSIDDEQEVVFRKRQIAWMKDTLMAVVISEEQGEMEKFRNWNIDISAHRKLIKQGFTLPDGGSLDIESAFKRETHPFRVAIVCAMWLTGFDVPSLATLYLDKPLKAHTLMQAIARANRVNEGKNNGLIVDYCGILRNLRMALATFSGAGDTGRDGEDTSEEYPARPPEELLADLQEAIELVDSFLGERDASLNMVIAQTGFARNAAIDQAKEAANENDETRKQFEVMSREVFLKFKACLTFEGVNDFKVAYDAVNVIYKSLQEDREEADISRIMKDLHEIVADAVTPVEQGVAKEDKKLYDISKIDFERLRQEFLKSPRKNSTVQELKSVIEKKLARLLRENPLRVDFQARFEAILDEYNTEKDRQTIEQTFDALLKLVASLDEEEQRHVREGLDEESLALFDLLSKADLTPSDIKRIKSVAGALLSVLKREKLKIRQWREKESTRDAVRSTIYDFLYSDETGLPETYSEKEIGEKVDAVFRHVYYAYPTVPSPIYART